MKAPVNKTQPVQLMSSLPGFKHAVRWGKQQQQKHHVGFGKLFGSYRQDLTRPRLYSRFYGQLQLVLLFHLWLVLSFVHSRCPPVFHSKINPHIHLVKNNYLELYENNETKELSFLVAYYILQVIYIYYFILVLCNIIKVLLPHFIGEETEVQCFPMLHPESVPDLEFRLRSVS